MLSDSPRVSARPWDGTDWVVTLDGRPVGRTLSRSEAEAVAAWLVTAVGDLEAWAKGMVLADTITMAQPGPVTIKIDPLGWSHVYVRDEGIEGDD